MSIRAEMADWPIELNGRDYRFGELPLILQGLLLVEIASYDFAASCRPSERAHVADHLRTIATVLEGRDPLVHRRRHDPRFLDGCVGHA